MQNNAWLLGPMLQRLKEYVCISIEVTPYKEAPESETTMPKNKSFTDLSAQLVQVCEQPFHTMRFPGILSSVFCKEGCRCLQTP